MMNVAEMKILRFLLGKTRLEKMIPSEKPLGLEK